MLLDAKARWPDGVHQSLWPYAIRIVVHITTTWQMKQVVFSYWKSFPSASKVATFSHFWIFSVCISISSWKCWGKEMGCKIKSFLYLGPSLMYAGSVSLVLSLETGLASFRFSVAHDDLLDTTSYNHHSMHTKSMWQVLTGLDYADTILR